MTFWVIWFLVGAASSLGVWYIEKKWFFRCVRIPCITPLGILGVFIGAILAPVAIAAPAIYLMVAFVEFSDKEWIKKTFIWKNIAAILTWFTTPICGEK